MTIEYFRVTLNKAAIRTRLIEKQILESEGEESIEDARVIIAGGRGCQKATNLELLKDVASQVGGVLAGTRAIVEKDGSHRTYRWDNQALLLVQTYILLLG